MCVLFRAYTSFSFALPVSPRDATRTNQKSFTHCPISLVEDLNIRLTFLLSLKRAKYPSVWRKDWNRKKKIDRKLAVLYFFLSAYALSCTTKIFFFFFTRGEHLFVSDPFWKIDEQSFQFLFEIR